MFNESELAIIRDALEHAIPYLIEDAMEAGLGKEVAINAFNLLEQIEKELN